MPEISRPPNRLLQVLPTAEFLSLHPHLDTVELANEAVLLEAGAPVQQVQLPHSGAVAMMVSRSRGQTMEVAIIGRDSVVGASATLDGEASLTDTIVVAPGTVSVLKAEGHRVAASRSSTLRNLLARQEQALSAHAQQSAACKMPRTRSKSHLSRLRCARDLCGSEGLPLTQEFLARMIGARRNTVSIVAHAFQQAGIVSYSQGQSNLRMSTVY